MQQVVMEQAMAGLGAGPLTEAAVRQWLRPLFSQTLAGGANYLVNHTLGRPLDRMSLDLAEGAAHWTLGLREAWAPWLAEEQAYRSALAGLLGLPRADCVVPKTSAGQALRAVLNTLPAGATVLTTRQEFASVSVVLAQYRALGRLRVVFAEADGAALATAIRREPAARLVVVSQVFFADSAILPGLRELAADCRTCGVELLVDCYHALGVLPADMQALGCDYVIGGCYKYLRGGPGAAFLALAPHVADGAVRPLDTGWFAQDPGSDAWAQQGPSLREGGDGWLNGTPPVLTYYQARSGLAFTRAVGVERLRAYSLEQLQLLQELLAERGIASVGGDAAHGAFLTVTTSRSGEIVQTLAEQGIVVDERDGRMRVCPDCLTTRAELEHVADAAAACLRH